MMEITLIGRLLYESKIFLMINLAINQMYNKKQIDHKSY